jgi:RES domain-containing protein
MHVFRICKTVYAQDMSGYGAKMYGGRWNKPGLAVLYTSFARSLAILELLVHFESKDALKLPYAIMKIRIPDHEIVKLEQNILPKDELQMNDPRLWKITEDYFKNKNALALEVPSMVVRHEKNYLLNPDHEKFSQCEIVEVENFQLDTRLYLV